MAIFTKNIPGWQEKKAQLKAEQEAREAKKPKKVKKKFKDLTQDEKDKLLKALAIKLDLIEED